MEDLLRLANSNHPCLPMSWNSDFLFLPVTIQFFCFTFKQINSKDSVSMFFLLKTFYSGKCLVNVPVSDVNFNFRIFFMKFEHHLFVVNWESCDTVFENFLSFDFWIKIIITFGNIDGFQRFYYGLMFVSLFINRTDGSLIWVDKIGTGRW